MTKHNYIIFYDFVKDGVKSSCRKQISVEKITWDSLFIIEGKLKQEVKTDEVYINGIFKL